MKILSFNNEFVRLQGPQEKIKKIGAMIKLKKDISVLSSNDIQKFKSSYLQFETGKKAAYTSMLDILPNKALSNLKTLSEYHDTLLFVRAYPRDAKCYSFAKSELERIHAEVCKIYAGNSIQKKTKLSGSGIAGSSLTGSFSYELVQWLKKTYPNDVRFDSSDQSDIFPAEILRMGLLPVETELIEKKDQTLTKWLDLAGRNSANPLQDFLGFFESMKVSIELRDYLYDSLKVFIDFDAADKKASRTFGHIHEENIFYHPSDFIKKPNLSELFLENISAPIPLSKEKKQEYVDMARIALCSLFRETDPVTFANADATEVFDMGRGLRIALYYLRSNRRLALDSYVGYMAFKNGIPCAYGGGWVFRKKSKIGINIFPPYRGGESAWIFTQLLRLYHKRFHVELLEAEPYQIGKNNPEGIQSGAFWFYYRLGFRPVQDELFELAATEWEKITSDKKYRTEAQRLRKLANSNLRLDCKNPGKKATQNHLDAQGFGKLITNYINQAFEGNRILAEAHFENVLIQNCPDLNSMFQSQELRHSFQLLLPVAFLLVSHSGIAEKNISLFQKWILSKAEESEVPFIELSQKWKSILIQ
ncbi:MAG: hypothetical protein IPG90_03250 [Bacteroidetes bacterium]|nr:hypothetical protein [Bacteroidota bacterium]